jgi:hypothetical protein
MAVPTLNHISDISFSDNMLRKEARASLEGLGVFAIDSKVCPKPVWYTAFFDGTGNNAAQDGHGKRSVEDTRRIQG